MDWDWHLIVEIVILGVAVIGTGLIWTERIERRRGLGLPTIPHAQWRVVGGPSGATLRIEVANAGAAAARCCLVMQVDTALYAGTFSLAEQQLWAPQTLERFDVLDTAAVAHSLLCVTRNLNGFWSATAPGKYVEAMIEWAVPFEVVAILRRATGRRYSCAVSSEGVVTIEPVARTLTASATTAG